MDGVGVWTVWRQQKGRIRRRMDLWYEVSV